MHHHFGNRLIHIRRQIPPCIGNDIFDIREYKLLVVARFDVCCDREQSVLNGRIDRIDLREAFKLILNLFDHHFVQYIRTGSDIPATDRNLIKC